jgi:type 1 fimbriae regulatory protein FimB
MTRTTRQIKHLSLDTVEALLASIKGSHAARNRAIFTIAFWRGLRISEVGMLQYSDWEDPRLYVRRAKGSNSAQYKLTQPEVKALRAWVKIRGSWDGPLFPSERNAGGRPGERSTKRPISPQRLHTLMKGYALRIGIPEDLAHFHVLRHSIAVVLTRASYTLPEIQDWLGHASIKSTAIYAAVTNAHRDELADSVLSRVKGEKPLEGKGWR